MAKKDQKLRMLQNAAECCRMLLNAAECCRMLQNAAECCRMLQNAAECSKMSQNNLECSQKALECCLDVQCPLSCPTAIVFQSILAYLKITEHFKPCFVKADQKYVVTNIPSSLNKMDVRNYEYHFG